jgi:ChaB/Rho termination factor, N-terminal domain
MPAREEMPSTIRRSDRKAQRTWSKAHDSAVETYGEGERSHRTAFAALKHTHEKKGDRWVPKDEPGPSDKQAERGAGDRRAKTAGGVNANASKQHLLEVARDLDIKGRSTMKKAELVDAIQKANNKATRKKQPSSK